MNILINYHYTLVEIFLLILILNIAIPTILRNKDISFIKWTRIGYFTFWALWAMVAFSGLIVFVFQKAILKFDIIIMIIATFILAIIESYRAIRQRKFWLNGELGLKFSNMIVSIEIIILLLTVYISIKY